MVDPCLLLLARPDDPAIRTLQQQAPGRVVHASIADLSCAGWQYVSGRPDQATAYAGGRVIPAERIAAVLCRIDAVTPGDLPHLHRDDRAYVAAEINAFLRAWLAQFTGVRFNEPTWVSLAGPHWHALTWIRLVTSIGVPVATLDTTPPTVTTSVVCGEVIGSSEPTLIDYSLRIALAARAETLEVQFVRDGEWRFLSANPCPTLHATSAAALLRHASVAHDHVLCNVA